VGLLVINADDWGAHAATTDAILHCFRAGRVSSATAMVFMEDSARAAAIGRRVGMPIGLHLNLTQPFAAAAVPEAVRASQQRLARHFRHIRLMRCVYDPRIRGYVERCIADQLEAFEAAYGSAPTHLDGHNHVHVCPNVLLSRTASRVRAARTTHSRSARTPAAAVRALRRRVIRRRFLSTDHLFAISAVHPALGGRGLEPMLELARRGSVELMVHPSRAEEYDVLMSDSWRRAIATVPLGSFADLG
jgi:chitin disaccharide deacetylase